MSGHCSENEYEYEYSDDEGPQTDDDMEFEVEDNPNAAPVVMPGTPKGEFSVARRNLRSIILFSQDHSGFDPFDDSNSMTVYNVYGPLLSFLLTHLLSL